MFPHAGKVLTISFLTACHPEAPDSSRRPRLLGLKIAGALALAVQEVNERSLLPDNWTLAFEVGSLL